MCTRQTCHFIRRATKKAVRLAWPSGDRHASDLFGLCHSGEHTTIGNKSWLTVGLARHVQDGQFCSGALLLSMIDRFRVQTFFLNLICIPFETEFETGVKTLSSVHLNT
jgi:hypothetical protein